MGLKITKAADPITVERLNVVIYAAPGLGKTSLGFTADAPLLLDFDNGAHRARNRGDAVRVSSWADVSGITAVDLEPYRTVVMDTAGRALDVLTAQIVKDNAKHGNGAGGLSLKGFGELKGRFASFLKLLNGFGKDVVLVVHAEEKQNGDDIIERLDMQGSSKNEVYKAADAMGRLTIRDGKRWLLFSPTDAAFGKNPGQLPPLAVPQTGSPEFAGFLAEVIQRQKDGINAMTESQREAAQEQAWFTETLPTVETVDGVNALAERVKAAGGAVGAIYKARAKALGFTWDKEANAFADPTPPNVEEPKATDGGADEPEAELADEAA